MNINNAFPSDYLKASDLTQDVTVIIERVELETLGQGKDKDTKPVVYFRSKKKGLVCNKTNSRTISKFYGDETDNWVGKAITIGPREVEFQGEMIMAIRVSLKQPQNPGASPDLRKAAPAPVKVIDEVAGPEDDNLDVPFN